MDKNVCKDCKYFLQHYIPNKRGFVRVYFGHCTFSRIKGKRPDSKVCEHFIEGCPDTELFASKEYLTKEIIKYFTSLEILPPIEHDKSTVV